MKLIIENVKKNFDKKEVLKGINFEFEKGKIYGLLGRNGAGKTTLFNCINEDIEDYTGNIYLEDNERRKPEIEDIGYVVSTTNVPEFLTGKEFIKFFLDINKERIGTPLTIEQYLNFINISKEDSEKLLKDYSQGMKNKIQMLVNIIYKPKVLLLDEPLTSLDVLAQEEMKNTLKTIKKDHIIIFSTHIMELALDLCDEIVVLNNGVLNKIDKDNLDNDHYKEKIINALKENNDARNI